MKTNNHIHQYKLQLLKLLFHSNILVIFGDFLIYHCNNFDYLFDPTFININRLFALSLRNGDSDPTGYFFNRYYMPLVETKYFNPLIENKPFFDQPVEKKQEAFQKHIEMSRNDDHNMGNLFDYLYHQLNHLYHLYYYFKLIGIDLSRQKDTIIPQKINFTEKIEEDNGATMFFIAEKKQKTILNFSLDSLIVTD